MTCSTMPRAISRSPMITVLAPSPVRCSTSASEWARAMISIAGLAARALSDDLAGLEGVGDGEDQPPRAGGVGGGEDLGVGGIAGDRLDAVGLAGAAIVLSASSMTRKGSRALLAAAAPTRLPTRP